MHQIDEKSLACLVVTISDTRTVTNDKSGQLIRKLLQEHGHVIEKHILIPDVKEEINQVVGTAAKDERIDAIFMTGGTGIAKRDITIEVVTQHFQKSIPGFGELFRMLSYTEDIGSKALMSRAVAGTVKGEKVLFALPGSSGAVRLAMNKLIIPELYHMYSELHK